MTTRTRLLSRFGTQASRDAIAKRPGYRPAHLNPTFGVRHKLNDADDLARLAHIKRALTAFEAGLLGYVVGTILTALILFGFHYHVL